MTVEIKDDTPLRLAAVARHLPGAGGIAMLRGLIATAKLSTQLINGQPHVTLSDVRAALAPDPAPEPEVVAEPFPAPTRGFKVVKKKR